MLYNIYRKRAFYENETVILLYSPKFARLVNYSLEVITGSKMKYQPFFFNLMYLGWVMILSGVFLYLQGLNMGKENAFEETLTLNSAKHFLVSKLILWLPGLVMALLICSIAAIMPFGSPIMNIPYMCFIAGYGLTMLITYSIGKVKGVEGKLPRPRFRLRALDGTTLQTYIVVLFVVIVVWYVLRSTMYRLIPVNYRLFWLAFSTILMTIGYYISGVESDMLDSFGESTITKVLYSLIQYIPLFLFVLFYLVIKSYSGLIGQIINLFLMYILCIPVGNYLRKQTGNRALGAVVTAFLFQALMITSAALIAF